MQPEGLTLRDSAIAVLSGGLATLGENIVTYPLEYTKTQLQLLGGSGAIGRTRSFTGVVDLVVYTYKHAVRGCCSALWPS
jgi:hypothetical protein